MLSVIITILDKDTPHSREKHHNKHGWIKKRCCTSEVLSTQHPNEACRCLLCGEAVKSGSAEANQSWWTNASWVFIIVGLISMPVRSSVALITGSLLWGWGLEAMLKDQNPLQDPVISPAQFCSHAPRFDLHTDQWQHHSGLITSYYLGVCACVCGLHCFLLSHKPHEYTA